MNISPCSYVTRATVITNEAFTVLFVMSCDVWPPDTDQVPAFATLASNPIEARSLQPQQPGVNSAFLCVTVCSEIC